MRRLISLMLGVIMFAVAVIVVAPFILPADTVKRELVSLIERNTGWRVALNGDVAMSLFPDIALKADDIEVSPPASPPVLSSKQARFSLSLSELISGTVAIQEIALEQPKIKLVLGDDGKPVFLQNDGTAGTSSAAPSETSDEGVVASLVNTLSVHELSVKDAHIEFGKQGETPTVIENLSLSASLPEALGALIVSGSATLSNETIAVESTIEAFKAFLRDGAGTLNAKLTFRDAELATNGNLNLNQSELYNGEVTFKSDDIQLLTSTDAVNRNSLSASGRLVARDTQILLTLEEGRLADTLFFIDLAVNTNTPKPVLSGSLDFGALDLETLLNSEPAADGEESSTTSQSVGYDLAALQSLDLDLSFTTGSIVSGEHQIEDLAGIVRLNDGVANLIIENVKAIGGSASGSLYADTKQSPLTTLGSFQADRLSVKTLLALAGQHEQLDLIDGLLGANINFGFQGTSPDNITQSINAKGSLSLFDATVSNLGLADSFNDPSADTISNAEVTVTIDGLSQPLKVNGAGNWRGQRLALAATTDPSALLAGENASAQIALTSSLAEIGFNGVVTPSFPVKGKLTAKGRSLRALAKWLDTDLPPGNGYGAFNIATDINATPTNIRLTSLNAKLDDLSGSGEMNVRLDAKPSVTGQVNFNLLDVNPYLATSESDTSGGSSATTASWSNEPIDFSALNAANIDLTARVKTFRAEGLTAGPLTLRAEVENGRLRANLTEMRLYNGTGTAEVNINAAGATPTLDISMNTSSISALPFLRDASDFDRIEGQLALDLDVTARGASEAALVSSLNGTSKFAFTNGAIRGINIARSMRALTRGALRGWNNIESEKTDFSAFNAFFDIQNGVATNNDLNLTGPLVRVTGQGSANMPAQSLNYRIDPKVVPTLQGQGGRNDLAGFSVPVIIEGAWAKPRIYPDIGGFLENPAEGIAKLRALGGGFAKIADSKPADLINQLAGGAGTQGDTSVTATAGRAVSTLLQNRNGDNQNGVAATAIGALGAALGGGAINAQPAAAPVPTGGVPIPRARPRAPAPAALVGNAVGNIIRNQIGNQSGQQRNNQDQQAPAQQIIQGLGNLLNRN